MLNLDVEERDVYFMRVALREAERALEIGEVPVGCVITRKNQVIARGCNRREALQDPTAHAEILAITAAANHLGSWRLEETTLYVTLEPCPMCAGAIILARIPRVVFGAFDPKAGCCGTLMNLLADSRFNHRPDLRGGVLEAECGGILSAFFREIRARGREGVPSEDQPPPGEAG
ncbi:MAG TPA: tRNA adenosine(34) deaminase TadA [Candidatus Hydrogenedentes bacterium]|nr:tRNA adenosine(34) deaminase TadA [Candidatus Hydrogenedentota bacterium]HOK89440.1 tRNA adenosine(34) deaminase TadA [Candidatus Hydrogenedentota bacterium]HPO30716.1 tRNA adenosine(34) deaminase TadA [Candidatus Hydrogenedentota bacterium]